MGRTIQKSSTSSSTGFTLIEVLVVVVIVAVLAAIAAPSWFGYLSRQRVRTVQNDLVEVLRQTQTKAVQLRKDQTATINVNAAVPTVQSGSATQELGGSSLGGALVLATNRASNAVTFDYLGIPVSSEANPTIPFVVTVRPANSPANSPTRRCVAVATLLGSIKTAQGNACDNF